MIPSSSKEGTLSNRRIQVAIGRFLYEIGAPLNEVKESLYFQPMIDAIKGSTRSEIFAPSYDDLQGWILKEVVDEVKKDVELCKTRWERTGCSLLASEWKTEKGQTFIDFLVYCSEQTVILKCEDVSGIIDSPDKLHDVFKKTVEEIGAQHIVQVITSAKECYMEVGNRLVESFPTVYWSPCAAHCIGLMLEEMEEVEFIKPVIEGAKFVIEFINKNSHLSEKMRNFTSGVDTTKPVTRFIMLKRMVDLKDELQSLILEDKEFWELCEKIMRFMEPLLKVLRMATIGKYATMGFFYGQIWHAQQQVKKEFPSEKDYSVCCKIINQKWNIVDSQRKNLNNFPLHAAGFFLNPCMFYVMKEYMSKDVMSGVLDCVRKLVPDSKFCDTIVKEIELCKDAVGSLGLNEAVEERDTLHPVDWWIKHGGSCPYLAVFAVRILSQNCSLVHLRHLGHYTMNREDLIFANNNLQLRQLAHKTQENGDKK